MCGIGLVTAELLQPFFFYSFLLLSILKESVCPVDHHPLCQVSQLGVSADRPGVTVQPALAMQPPQPLTCPFPAPTGQRIEREGRNLD